MEKENTESESPISFKDLSAKKKAEYIWDYYKIHIIAAIVIVFVGGSLINRWFINPPPEKFCGVAIYGPHIDPEDTDTITERINARAADPAANETAETINFFFTQGKNEEDILQDENMQNKFSTYMFASELDIFIGNKSDFDVCVKADILAPVTNFLKEDKVKELEDNGRVFYDEATENPGEKPYGILLNDSALCKELDILQDDDYYLGFIPIKDGNTKIAEAALIIIE